MVYRSIGVIFGDLGTSPMYIFSSTFDHPPSRVDAMGALSLIFWTLTLLALLKYVLIVLWANDNGEGKDPLQTLLFSLHYLRTSPPLVPPQRPAPSSVFSTLHDD